MKTMSEIKGNLPEDLFYESPNGFDGMSAALEKAIEAYCDEYKAFLDRSKTERLCSAECIRLAEAQGFRPLERDAQLKSGDRVYYDNKGKGVMLAVIGKKSLNEGANISAAHIDSPRFDLTPHALFEEGEMAYFETHTYGWPRPYHWVTLPLALHGVVQLRDGTQVAVNIGEEPGEPQFIITDLLPHMGREQKKLPLGEAFPSNVMRVFVGSRPLEGMAEGKRFKGNVLAELYRKYGIVEADLISAELEVVPAGGARDIGFDRSMIASYGHDDRVCAYAQLKALLEQKTPEKTAICIFCDKEEVDSQGVSSMQSMALEFFMNRLCKAQGADLYECFTHSFCINFDVEAAYDPSYHDYYDMLNAARVNHGVVAVKYTGSQGDKSDASDASAEAIGRIRSLFDRCGVLWQMGNMGKPELGGGGTMAKFIAKRNVDTIDVGVPLLSMHAPFELAAKIDCYMAYRAICAFFSENNN